MSMRPAAAASVQPALPNALVEEVPGEADPDRRAAKLIALRPEASLTYDVVIVTVLNHQVCFATNLTANCKVFQRRPQ